jgi:hypothetical protein
MGAYIASRSRPGAWIDAYWRTNERVVDVTGTFPILQQGPAYLWRRFEGAGNSFLGGLAAGLALTNGDVFEGTYYMNRMPVHVHVHFIFALMGFQYSATFHATVSSSYTIEQFGLPQITRPSDDARNEEWNGDSPWARLQELKARFAPSQQLRMTE